MNGDCFSVITGHTPLRRRVRIFVGLSAKKTADRDQAAVYGTEGVVTTTPAGGGCV